MSSFIPNNENNKDEDVDVGVGIENDGSDNYDKNANNGDTDNINIFENWDSDLLNIKSNLLRGIYAIGFETPSPIQKEAIIPITKKRDIMAQAQSGTGKTGAFCIGSLQIVDESLAKPQILMISPTRELALQTYEVLEKLGNFMKIKIHMLVGGTSITDDTQVLENDGPQFIVGTPGRIHDMIRRNILKTNNIKLLILDEADEMLSIGFKDQVYNIFQNLNNEIQVGLFSATIPDELNALTEKFMRDPVKILVKSDMLTLEGISQYYVAIEDDEQKYSTLKDLFSIISVSQCIIYCNSIKRVQELYNAMIEDNFPVCCIHSNMDKGERTNSYNDFKSGKHRVLISSNVTARGIDIQQVSTVINFDVPKCARTYLHRIGRSGRWGRKGVGINFVTKFDIQKMQNIEQYYSTQIEELPTNFQDNY
tara:strand:- start:15 stop:1283 length:1269 start_codon:yes stop_codon:yes gene_type:complete